MRLDFVYPLMVFYKFVNRKRKWTVEQLKDAVHSSISLRQVIQKLGLIPAGGNYDQMAKYIQQHSMDISHFKGKGWSRDIKKPFLPAMPLEQILVNGSRFHSYQLKFRLFREGLKNKACEMCGWAQYSPDGRLPLELDHINGDRHDNRLENLRVLCPNCHSMQPTHRRKKKKTNAGMV